MKSNLKRCLLLFLSTMRISAFTFGGGYVIVSLMKKQFVDKLGWLEEGEMLDYTAMAQSAPGPIAINASILVGYRVGGAMGAFFAILGTILPPLVLLTAISYVYEAFIQIEAIRYLLLGMQAGVIAVICDVVCGLCRSIWRDGRWMALATAATALILVAVFSVNVILIVLACALMGVFLYGKGEKK
jgi:chromate transporter